MTTSSAVLLTEPQLLFRFNFVHLFIHSLCQQRELAHLFEAGRRFQLRRLLGQGELPDHSGCPFDAVGDLHQLLAIIGGERAHHSVAIFPVGGQILPCHAFGNPFIAKQILPATDHVEIDGLSSGHCICDRSRGQPPQHHLAQ